MADPKHEPHHAAQSKPEPAPKAPEPAPGKAPEEAAVSGADPTVAEGMAPLGQGAQVVLTGDAAAAARGGTHSEILYNTTARDEAILAGHVAPGTTASAAADATTSAFDEIDEAEAAAIAKARADARAARAARAAAGPKK
jgi:hypothetical protein